jgi:tRNA threonylcarbamoyladenosine biosynthesis protein TsaB
MSNRRDFDQLNDANGLQKDLQRGNESGPDPLVLSIDTATDARSVALVRGDSILALRVNETRESSSTSILSDIDRVLKDADTSLKRVQLFAVASGPGSFTGLRAGLATVKGFAVTLKKKAIGVPTLSAVAHSGKPSARTIALIPAGRGEVFAQQFRVSFEGVVEELSEAIHLPPEELIEIVLEVRGRVRWAGSGVGKYRDLIEGAARKERIAVHGGGVVKGLDESRVWEVPELRPELAPSVAELAKQILFRRDQSAAVDLRAIYVRPADARISNV